MYPELIYPREKYLSRLRPFYDAVDLVKMFCGARGCGKSAPMRSDANELRAGGVPNERIVELHLSIRGCCGAATPTEPYRMLQERTASGSGIAYVFIDILQNVRDAEPVLNSWIAERSVSIFAAFSDVRVL